MATNGNNDKSLESWIWDAACSIRGAKDAPKYKDYILPLIFTKRLCDVFDDEVNRIAKEVGSRAKAFKLVKADWKQAKKGGQTPTRSANSSPHTFAPSLTRTLFSKESLIVWTSMPRSRRYWRSWSLRI